MTVCRIEGERRGMRRSYLLRGWGARRPALWILAIAAALAQVMGAPPIEVTVALGPDHDGVALPMEFQAAVPGANRYSGDWQLRSVDTDEMIPCQVGGSGSDAVWRFVVPATPIRHAVVRRFLATDATKPRPVFAVEDDGQALTIRENDRPVLAYNHAMQLKAGVDEKFRRSCYIHPIYDLDGVILTDDFPKDHYHHRGLCWTWPHVRIGDDDKIHDLWALVGMGQKLIRVLGTEVGPVCARVGVEAGWYRGDDKVIRETVWLTVFRADDVGRVIDLDLTLEATGAPVTIGGREKKGYGGFTLRFAPRDDTVLWTSGGPVDRDADHDRFGWADLSARLMGGSGISGAAIFDHPQNPGLPNTWCLRRYGIVSPTYPGLEKHEIRVGAPLRLRYRMWIHRGDADSGRVAAAYAAYAVRPEIRVAPQPSR